MGVLSVGRARLLVVRVILCLCCAGYACPADNAPYFTAAGVVQAATQTAGRLAPNAIATIYGTNLSWTTHAVTAGDLNSGTLPTSLEGVTVYVNNMTSNLVYVSPTQINFLVPYEIVAPSVTVVVARQGVAGPIGPDGKPSAIVPFAVTAPGFFEWNGNFAVAEHGDGSLITPDAAAQPGEIVVLYATGLGRVVPDSLSGEVPQRAAPILYLSQLQILVNGIPLPHESVLYAGVTPGFAGLYQINVRLPEDMSANPQIQVAIGDEISPGSVQLYAN